MTPVYAAIESGDDDALRALLRPDAFVMTPAATGVLRSADAVITDIGRWYDGCRFEVTHSVTGTSPSGGARWVFDQVLAGDIPLRVTALLARDDSWRVAAAYWSIPYDTQAEQDAVKAAGQLEPGIELSDQIAVEAEAYAQALKAALAAPSSIPDLYSTVDAAGTIGSVIDEVFIGAAGRAAWEEFVQHVHAFSLRGPMCGTLVAPDAGWLAANIDILQPPTPYRFFYVWVHSEDAWRIVVSHDAVSRDPRAPVR